MISALRPPAAVGFVLRTLLAYTIALYAAYALELDTPYSAGTTVLIVAASSRGAVLSKSFWRIIGSVIGGAAATVLMALFAQTPVLFVIGLAVWLGVCTFTASLMRYFRGYAAVLSGYTVVLVAFGAIANPENVFLLAASRVAVVTIGVLATCLVSMALDFGPGRGEVIARLCRLTADTARLLQTMPATLDEEALGVGRSQIAAGLTALDQSVEFAAVEEAGFKRFTTDLRMAAAELFSALTGGPRAMSLIRIAAGTDGRVEHARTELLALLSRIATLSPSGLDAATLLSDLATARTTLADRLEADPTHVAGSLPMLSALEETATLLEQFSVAVEAVVALQRRKPRTDPLKLPAYVDPHTALRNGVRAFLAVTIGGLFWIYTDWSSGATSLVAIGPITALLAQSESAAAASIGFFKGMVLACAVGFLCTFGVLPHMSGFVLLLMGILPFITVALYATQIGFAGTATPFLIFFNSLVAPSNPMQYDLAPFLNTTFAFIFGAAASVLAFRVLLPPNPAAEASNLQRSISAAVRRLLSRPMPSRLAWETLQHQKMVRMSRRLASDPARRRAAIAQASCAVLIGRRLGQLRRIARDGSLPAAVAQLITTVLQDMRRGRTIPQAAALAQTTAASLFAEARPAAPVLHAAIALHDLAELLAVRESLLWPDTILDTAR